MIIQYVCPKCGGWLQFFMLPSNPPKERVECTQCDWSSEESEPMIEVPYIPPIDKNITDIPTPCLSCPNHPSNGGSGLCNCTLGSPTFY